jgi:8-oxo-dGTP pyrophosphatase MutT (NUDIX family)
MSKFSTVCAGGFLLKKNKFLFGKRSKKKNWAPGLWDIVGGHSLKNEHPLYTLQRETFEESGVTVLNAELLWTTDVRREKGGEVLFTYHVYMVTHFKGKAYNKSKEHTKLKWFTRVELEKLSLALPEYISLIDEWLSLRN